MTGDPRFLLEQGFQHHQQGRLKQAEDFYRRALKVDPNEPNGLNLLAIVVNETGRRDEAIKLLEKAVRVAPGDPQFANNLGQLYKAAGRREKAITAYRKALDIDPHFADAHNNLANALADSGRQGEAIGHYRLALAETPDDARVHYNLATTLFRLGNFRDAADSFQTAIEIVPDYAEAHNNLGYCLTELMLADKAIDHLQRALTLRPDYALAHNNMGNALALKSDWEAAARHYRKALSLDPADDTPIVNLTSAMINACDWKDLAATLARAEACIDRALAEGRECPEGALAYLTKSDDLARNRRIAASHSALAAARAANLGLSFSLDGRRREKPVLTLGYISFDFRDHVVAHLSYKMFELHDRSGFRVIGYSSGRDDGSFYRNAIREGCDRFVDIRNMSNGETARRIHDDQVDILIDLNGFTQGGRTVVAALRPAPLQVGYLGFPGTMGGDFFDYIVLDPVVASEATEVHFSEKIIYLPPYYMPTTVPKEQPSARFARVDVGLPEDAVVFCCFNRANKLELATFGRWMNMLKKIPGSVLWLIDDNPAATANLKHEATRAGVDPARLIFAKRAPKPDHMARLALADIALDTRVYNGGATTSDALSAGVPVVAMRGNHVPSRVSASMLSALGMPELIAADLDGYEALALSLAGDSALLARTKAKLTEKDRTSYLFDLEGLVRSLERAYRKIWDGYARGDAPGPVHIRRGDA